MHAQDGYAGFTHRTVRRMHAQDGYAGCTHKMGTQDAAQECSPACTFTEAGEGHCVCSTPVYYVPRDPVPGPTLWLQHLTFCLSSGRCKSGIIIVCINIWTILVEGQKIKCQLPLLYPILTANLKATENAKKGTGRLIIPCYGTSVEAKKDALCSAELSQKLKAGQLNFTFPVKFQMITHQV